jgi:hypothetical protein
MGSSERTPKTPNQKANLKAEGRKPRSQEVAPIDGSFRLLVKRRWHVDLSPREGSMRLPSVPPNREPTNEHFPLNPAEQYVVFAALAAMVADVHTVQDQLNDEQWSLAKKVYKRLTKVVDKRHARHA